MSAGPFLTTTISSGDTVPVGSPAQIATLIGCSPLAGVPNSGVSVGSTFTFAPGNDPRPVIGLGMLCDQVLYLLRNTNQFVNVTIAAATWATPPPLTHYDAMGGLSPSGPTVTIGLGSGVPGNLDDMSLILRITAGGALGTAQGSIAYDGGPGVETFTLPVPLPGMITGTAPITPTTLGETRGLTLVFAAPAAQTLTFLAGSLSAVSAGIMGATATVTGGASYTSSNWAAGGVVALAGNPRKLRWTTTGATPAHAPSTIAVVGVDYAGNPLTESVTPSGTLNGTVDTVGVYAVLTSWSYTSAGGTDASLTVGYEDAFASVSELVTAANALAVGAPLAVVASAPQTSVGTYLAFATTATGTSATVTLNASPGTGATVFGFTSNETATGAAAARSLPNSGHVLTFPTGTYVTGESYTDALQGPRASISAIVAAANAAVTAFATNPFGLLVVAQPADTAANCAATVTALETVRAAALVATVPRDFYCVVGGPWHIASAVASTNQSNITTNDNALQNAFATGQIPNPNTVAHDDVYLPTSSLLAPGDMRRTSAIAFACKRMSASRVAATAAEGNVPEAVLVAGNGSTLARDQNTATVHLEGVQGPGFFVLKTANDNGNVKFSLGATRAGATSRLADDGTFAVCVETARLAQAVVKPWEGQKPGTDPLTGQMAGHDKGSRAGQVDAAIRPFLLPYGTTDNTLPNCADFGVVVQDPPTGLFVNNGIAPVTITIDVLGQIQNVIVAISATGVTTITAPAI